MSMRRGPRPPRHPCARRWRAARPLVVGVVITALAACASTPSAGAPDPDARAAWLHELDRLESRTLSLARAMPAAALRWRPMEGVSSGLQVYGHVSYVHYRLSGMAGTPPPAAVDLDAVRAPPTKEAALAQLEASFAHLRRAIAAVPVGELDREAEFWGRPSTVRRVLLRGVLHTGEHLGQMIAYARANGVAPPWSQ